MVQRGERLRFALEAGEALRILRERLGQHLDRHLAPERGVGGAIDLAHAAGAEGGEDFVGAEAGAGSEGPSLLGRHEALQFLGPVLHDDDLRWRGGLVRAAALLDHQEPLAVG